MTDSFYCIIVGFEYLSSLCRSLKLMCFKFNDKQLYMKNGFKRKRQLHFMIYFIGIIYLFILQLLINTECVMPYKV